MLSGRYLSAVKNTVPDTTHNTMDLVMSLIVAILLVGLTVKPVPGQPLNPEQAESLRSFVQAVMECRNQVGATVALVRGGEVAFTQGFGFQNIEAGESILNV